MWSPTAEEQSFAAAVWARVAGGAPSLPAASAAALLSTSGLPRETLSAIWMLADPYDSGMLTFPAFCYALRGVSMAQVGAQVSPEAYVAMARVPLPLAKLAASSPSPSTLQHAPQPPVGANAPQPAVHNALQQHAVLHNASGADDKFGDFGAPAAPQGPTYSLDDAFAEMGFSSPASAAALRAHGTSLESPALQVSPPALKPAAAPVTPALLPDDDEFGNFGTAPTLAEQLEVPPPRSSPSPFPAPAHSVASSPSVPAAGGGLKKIGASSFAPARAALGGPAPISLTIGAKPASTSRAPVPHAPPTSPPSMSLASFLDAAPLAVDAAVRIAVASSLPPVDPNFVPFSDVPKANAAIEPIMLFSALSGALDAIDKVVIRPVSEWHAAVGRGGVSAADIACAMRRLKLADELYTQALIRLDALPRSADLAILRKNEIARVHAAVDEVELLRAMTSSLQDNGASTTINEPRAAASNAPSPSPQPFIASSSTPGTRTTPLKAAPAIVIHAAERGQSTPAGKLLPPSSQKSLLPAPHAAIVTPPAFPAPHALPQVPASTPGDEFGNTDEFGGFSSSPGATPPVAHAMTSIPKSSPNALSAFDDLLAGADLSAPPVIVQALSSPVFGANAVVEHEDFELHQNAAAPSIAAPVTTPSNSGAAKIEDNDDEFGSFGAPSSFTPAVVSYVSPSSAFNIEFDAPSPAPRAMMNPIAAVAADSDVFSSVVHVISSAAPASTATVFAASVTANDELGSFEPPQRLPDVMACDATSTTPTLAPVILETDDFGDFGESSATPVAPLNPPTILSPLHAPTPRTILASSAALRDVAHQLRESRSLACAAAAASAAAAKLSAIEEDRLDDAISAKKRSAAALERGNGAGWPCASPALDACTIASAALGPDAVSSLLTLACGRGGGGEGGLAELAVESLPRAVAARSLLLRSAALCDLLRSPSAAAPGAPSLAAAFTHVLSGGARTAAKARALLDRAPTGAVNTSARVQEFLANMTGLARFFTRVAATFAPVLFIAPPVAAPEEAMAAAYRELVVTLESFEASARALGVTGDAAGVFSAALSQLRAETSPARTTATLVEALASDENALSVWAGVTPGDAVMEAAAVALLGEDGKVAKGVPDLTLLTKAWSKSHK